MSIHAKSPDCRVKMMLANVFHFECYVIADVNGLGCEMPTY